MSAKHRCRWWGQVSLNRRASDLSGELREVGGGDYERGGVRLVDSGLQSRWKRDLKANGDPQEPYFPWRVHCQVVVEVGDGFTKMNHHLVA